MLKILSINPSGLFSYGSHPTINIDNLGLCLFDGINKDKHNNSNASGKTSLLNALTHILYDQNPLGKSGDSIINSIWNNGYFGKVEFIDHLDKDKWRVISVRKWKKSTKCPATEVLEEQSQWLNNEHTYSGTDIFLERWDSNNSIWVDERVSSDVGTSRLDSKNTRNKIVSLLGLDYDQFTSITYIAQQSSLRFIGGGHKIRLEILSELCELGAWDRRIEKLKIEEQSKQSRLEQLKSKLIGIEYSSPPPIIDIQSLLDGLSFMENEISKCDKDISLLFADQKKQSDISQQLQVEMDDILGKLTSMSIQRSTINEKLESAYNEHSQLRQNIQNKKPSPDIYILENDIGQVKGQIYARKLDLDNILTGAGKCPRCRLNVTEDHLERERKLLSIGIKELEESLLQQTQTLQLKLEGFNQEILSELDLEIKRFTEIKNDLDSALNITALSIESLNTTFNNLNAKKLNIVNPETKINSLLQSRMLLLSKKSQIDEKLEETKELQIRYNNIEDTAKALKLEINTLEEDIKYNKILQKLFGDKGIKAHKLDTTIPRLNTLIQQYLDIITDDSIQAWITPFREKVDGSTTADIQIIVRDGLKTEVPFELYSGGEKQQISLAFAGAFWQLANESGSGTNILFLDEIFGPMDDYNTTKVFEYLSHMQSLGTSTILLTTHNSAIKRSVKFDTNLTVIKSNGISSIQIN